MNNNKYILYIIVLAQFCGTSLWFAGNAVMQDVIHAFSIDESALGNLTSVVQLGFILGTLIFAVLTIIDRFLPSRIFFFCAFAGALFNLSSIWSGNTYFTLLTSRLLTGFFLAGIYPVGMKIAADYYQKGLGKSLGFLVGALVLGTAFPHLLKSTPNLLNWKSVMVTTSTLSASGGLLLLLFVPKGPYHVTGAKANLSAFIQVFSNKNYRTAAFGYFGHMWELYAFWAFVPYVLKVYNEVEPAANLNVSLSSFAVIGVGSLGCVFGGLLSLKYGAKRVAFVALLTSGICCLISPLIIQINTPEIVILFLLIWGIAVVADSPLFSTLIAQNASPELKGTSITIATTVGFLITIFSIQLLSHLTSNFPHHLIFLPLAIGPALGLWALHRNKEI